MNRSFVAQKIALGAVIALASAGACLAAADDLPKADTILDKMVEVTGGKAAYQKIHSEVTTGTIQVSGLKGSNISYKAEPDKSYTEITFEGIGKIANGSNGKVAWSNSAMQGPHVMEGEEKETALLMARFDDKVGWREIFTKAETVGTETVEGKDCYKLQLTPKVGKPMTQYYDKSTGLLVKMSMTIQSPMGEVTAENTLDDYRKDGDILSPHKISTKAAGQQFTITVDKVEYNVDIPASRFDVPPEIQALLDKAKK